METNFEFEVKKWVTKRRQDEVAVFGEIGRTEIRWDQINNDRFPELCAKFETALSR